ncbi:MAG: hypothetical protein H6721_27920 [Sandaracinus sp.]|nr:hypothetical protein [Sandaracinus sp.]MCB9635955.1 hypothetical protein [Sandaracinus sp.]
MYAIGLLLATSLGCEEPAVEQATLEPERTRVDRATGPTLETEPRPETQRTPETERTPEAPPESRPLGRWVPATDGNLHCLELGADGAFELTRRASGHGPEMVARGRYVLEGDVLKLHVATLHQERWVSRCRKHVTHAGPAEVLRAFGTELRPERETRLRLRRADAGLELCGPQGRPCELLRRRED